MIRRRWVNSGIQEDFDLRQQRFLDLVLSKIRHYYRELYGTRSCYQHPLSLKQLMKLTNRSSYAVIGAVRVLSNSIPVGEKEPSVFYDRVSSERNPSHRPYRIFLNTRKTT